MTEDERRALLADLAERILTAHYDDKVWQSYVDIEMGIFDVAIDMRPEWIEAAELTRQRFAATLPDA